MQKGNVMQYVHGYGTKENIRLRDQASTLAELLHADTLYPPGSRVLEAGCGVGAQTVNLAANSPTAFFTSVDISVESLAVAAGRIKAAALGNVNFVHGDIFNLPFEPASFDHIFVCFVLEHLARPEEALRCLGRLVRTGGTIVVIEGDHGSAYFHPDDEAARKIVSCQIELQKRAGGNANIGRMLYPLLRAAGFSRVRVSPRMVYADAGHPQMAEGFTRRTFTAMIEGVREPALAAGLVDEQTFDAGIRAPYKTSESDGVFCYTFFKAVAEKDETSITE